MTDRFAFSDPTRDPNGGWFKIGDISATTSIVGTIVAVAALLANAISNTTGGFANATVLSTEAITNLEIWRFFTWPLANEVSFWSFLSIVVFALIGSQLETILGKERLLGLIVSGVVLPAIVATTVSLLIGQEANIMFGWTHINLTLIVAFAAVIPFAQFFFRIPAWVFGILIVLLQLIVALADRQWIELFYTVALTVLCLTFLNTTGHLHPEISKYVPAKAAKPKKNSHLTSVPDPIDNAEMDRLLDKINNEGMSSLSKDEKKRLKQLSEQMKDS